MLEALVSPDSSRATLPAIPAYPTEILPLAARELVRHAKAARIPEALTAGAAIAAMAAAIGPSARLSIPGWYGHQRAILWVALLAEAGVGKSPAQDMGFGPVREYDEKAFQRILLGDSTLESLARDLHAAGGAAALDLDELVVLLRGLGEYKRGGGGDSGRFLGLWTGSPWRFTRVGGGGRENKTRLHIDKPTLVICGGMQPRLHGLLGGDMDGMRPRWLPHLAADAWDDEPGQAVSYTWPAALDPLLQSRGSDRMWEFDARGQRAFAHYEKVWKRQARSGESPAVSVALQKANVHLGRFALVFAEAEQPGKGGLIGSRLVENAAAEVEFTLDSWRALPDHDSMALTRRDQTLDKGVDALLAWVERREGREATRREIQRAGVAGVRIPSDVDALIGRYAETFPGCVVEHKGASGPSSKLVRAPERSRRPRSSYNRRVPDGYTSTDGDSSNHGGFEGPEPPDSFLPDSLLPDGFRG